MPVCGLGSIRESFWLEQRKNLGNRRERKGEKENGRYSMKREIRRKVKGPPALVFTCSGDRSNDVQKS